MAKNPFLKKATPGGKTPAKKAAKRHGLGRGLDSLIPAKPVSPVSAEVASAVRAPEPAGDPLELPIMDIERSPYQPRREFKDEELRELADSIKSTGLVQPPTVRRNAAGRYELIAGERRIRAAQLAGLRKIRVTVVEADDQAAAFMTATENLQREDLNPIEEATSYRTLQDRFGLTQQEVADKIGKGRATVANSVRLLELPEEVKELVRTKLLSAGHAKLLLSVEDEKTRVILAREAVNGQLTVRALERKVQRILNPVKEAARGVPDIPEGYVRTLVDKLKKHLGCAVRLTSGVTYPGKRHTKGLLEIDLYNNDDLDRVIRMIGLDVE